MDELLFLILRYAQSRSGNKAVLVFLLLSLFEKCLSAAYSFYKCTRASPGEAVCFGKLRYGVAVAFGTWRGIAGIWELWVKHELKLAEP